ncbi:unnamed protein product [Brassicogethes aeneus]|uniref:Uncharacterized protein n=1 Tax=Brassicogethes aeneus TaxID=1431903 RepID=A0A9P0FB81_BRAAE|nr:unnamed protein product [Brassicogethes aeneus]
MEFSCRKRHQNYSYFYADQDQLCFCVNVNELFNEIGLVHDTKHWRLFIDSFVSSYIMELPSIPVSYSAHLKEDYANVKTLLEKIQYHQYQWDVCGDFKMLGFFLGLQGGYTKYSCFLCKWDSRADKENYVRCIWPAREDHIPGKDNVINEPL